MSVLLRFSGSARMEPRGSTPTTTQAGHFSLILRPMPEMVPPVPAPSTTMSTLPPHCSRISSAVVS